MSDKQHVDLLIIGSGEAGKNLAWAMASGGQRVAVIECKLIGGSCPNIACLPTRTSFTVRKWLSSCAVPPSLELRRAT